MTSMVEAKDVKIYDSTLIQNLSPSNPDIQKIQEHVDRNAFYDSQERAEEANAQHVNRIAHEWEARMSTLPPGPTSDLRDSISGASVVEDVIQDIFTWLRDSDWSTYCRTMWVHDDDRSRTSLIAQVVAEILAKRKELAAAYFFPRLADQRTGTTRTVVPTIAYQLMCEIPQVETYMARALAHDAVSNLKVHGQVNRLVTEPLKQASESLKQLQQSARAHVIIVHALEDCDNAGFQTMFLDAFTHGLASIDSIPFSPRLILLGRSTDHLRECFSKLPERIRHVQRPVHVQHWRTREQDIDRRVQKCPRCREWKCDSESSYCQGCRFQISPEQVSKYSGSSQDQEMLLTNFDSQDYPTTSRTWANGPTHQPEAEKPSSRSISPSSPLSEGEEEKLGLVSRSYLEQLPFQRRCQTDENSLMVLNSRDRQNWLHSFFTSTLVTNFDSQDYPTTSRTNGPIHQPEAEKPSS